MSEDAMEQQRRNAPGMHQAGEIPTLLRQRLVAAGLNPARMTPKDAERALATLNRQIATSGPENGVETPSSKER